MKMNPSHILSSVLAIDVGVGVFAYSATNLGVLKVWVE
jgi:hypothetical protein